MNEFLIISNEQFGYHTDSFKYCQYLKDKYRITYLSFDKGLDKILMPGVTTIYVPWRGIKIYRSFRFFFRALRSIILNKGVVFIIYFNGLSLLHFFTPWKKKILDIRTLSVSPDKEKRKREDSLLRITAKYFPYISVVSYGIRDKLNLSINKTYLLPLGADKISHKQKKYDSLHLLYVGTLNGRSILDTVKGFNEFHQSNSSIPVSYDIIGEGDEKNKIEEYIKDYNLSEIVKLHGYIHHKNIIPFFDKCNIGVSYIPMTEYYENQPATKTFEYIFSGLYTIATATYSNKQVVTPVNGILINDTPADFARALCQIVEIHSSLDYDCISSSLSQYEWKSVVDVYLSPLLEIAGK